ncbi:hypothetical protein [Novipirellula artificiosorum]|uniref:Uncharacterized protein n=1 Tax=Novipirellula artificiosorum TaxID=2528016 RepID=A0A5C6CJI6_9BACT|nr:hypothetical protein [Novipirellula artificiosorum]TWU23511.1 hypothetical protein Poly41_71110 [Novipirellula artificiosorum]
MNRYVAPFVFLAVLIGTVFSIAATQDVPHQGDSRFAGKAVIIQTEGVYFGVRDDVRFESIGSTDYIVLSSRHDRTYDQWYRLDIVDELKIFDSKEEALSYDKMARPNVYRTRESKSGEE